MINSWQPCPPISDLDGAYFSRPYGLPGDDLRIDFGLRQPHLVTALLCACIKGPDGPMTQQTAWDLNIGSRIQLLLTILQQTHGRDHEFQHTCGACGEVFEITASGQDMQDIQREGEELGLNLFQLEARDHCPALQFRRPTGSDQLNWLDQDWTGETQAMQAMIRSIVQGELPQPIQPERLQQAAQLLDEADPLVNFTITSACPACGKQQSWTVDLTDYALRGLNRARGKLLHGVHRIARAYHWSEESILDLPPARRREYLSLIDREARQ